MSNIGKKSIHRPSISHNITISHCVHPSSTLGFQKMEISGPLGTQLLYYPLGPELLVTNNLVTVSWSGFPAGWGSLHTQISQMIRGVTEGFSEEIYVTGVGYRVEIENDAVIWHVGYGHSVKFSIPKGVKMVSVNSTTLKGWSSSYTDLTGFLNKMKQIRPSSKDKYKGKGIRVGGSTVTSN